MWPPPQPQRRSEEKTTCGDQSQIDLIPHWSSGDYWRLGSPPPMAPPNETQQQWPAILDTGWGCLRNGRMEEQHCLHSQPHFKSKGRAIWHYLTLSDIIWLSIVLRSSTQIILDFKHDASYRSMMMRDTAFRLGPAWTSPNDPNGKKNQLNKSSRYPGNDIVA